jgi:hypothetical protein
VLKKGPHDHSPGRELSKRFSACGGAQLRLDSVLKPKNTENSTKNGQNQKHQENCPISPWHSVFFGPFLSGCFFPPNDRAQNHA